MTKTVEAGDRVAYVLPDHKHCTAIADIREAIVQKIKDGDMLNLLVLIDPADFAKNGRIAYADLDENDKPIRLTLGKVIHNTDGSFFYVNNVEQGSNPNNWYV